MLADIPIWDWHWDWWVDRSSWQLWFNGFTLGLVYGLIAMGIVLIYRSTKVINLAVGNMGLPAMGLMAITAVNYNFPYWIALAVALAVGTLGGAVTELAVIRRLFEAPRVIVLVATIGIAQLMQAILITMPDATPGRGEGYPVAASSEWTPFWDIDIEGPELMIIIVVPLVAIVLSLFLNRTVFGQTVQASASNADLARLQGINPRMVSLFVWSVAGFLGALAMILLAGRRGEATGIQNLGPVTMTRALIAAVLAGMYSFPRALVAGVAIGLLETHLIRIHLGDVSLVHFVLFIIVVGYIIVQYGGEVRERASFAFVSKRRPVPAHLREVWWIRHFIHFGPILLLTIALIVPLLIDTPSRHRAYARVAAFAVCALSVTVITGWSGQVSLAQMAFAGFGALFAAAFQRGLHMGVGWGERWQLFAFTLPELPFVLTIVLAGLTTAVIAAVVGVGSLRVRGLLLAVTTFAFAIAAQTYLFRRDVLDDGGGGTTVDFERGDVGWWTLATERDYYYLALIVLVIALIVVARLRRSGIGRSIIAVRDNEDTASAYAVSPVRMKVMAFALAGGIAGIGGALLAGMIESVPLANQFFTLDDSLRVVAMVVIGGLGTIVGPVIGSLWVIGLPSFWPDNELVPLFTSSLGLLILILYFPAGLVHAGYAARDALVDWVAVRRPPPETPPERPAVTTLNHSEWDPEGRVALQATDIEVRFGGILAVAGVDFEAAHGEIVGLIGTNGAGKSTLLNAVGGYVPAAGRIELNGKDVTNLAAYQRARRGLGRTFQSAELFPELTVRETVLVALEARQRTGFLSTALYMPHAMRRDRRKRQEAAELIDFLGLGRYVDTFVNELSTGTRRIVELAGLLALDAHVLCLDEPTAGLAQRETEAFGPLIRSIQRELNATMVVIEHDMGLIMSLSDRVYCLEDGLVISEGTPDEVRRDPAVIASYLGTDRRAIERSGTLTSGTVSRPPGDQ
jgi:ABC-type branched-subunit amino acid transport system ATPase component/ABC-type branched-subunit amino acid transport system permease subunit